jgi:hypothetical protein
MGSELDRPFQFDLVAAQIRAESTDLDAFVESLATKLEQATPGMVQVERVRSGFRGPKRVRRITVDGGGIRLELRADGGNRVEAKRARVSGGITLSSEPLDVDDWIAALSGALAEEAERNQKTRQALERLLLG